MDYIHNSEKSYHYHKYLRYISAFAESVGIEVLYEGIETQQQLDMCTSLNGRYFQGFLIAAPQPLSPVAVVNNDVFSASIKNNYVALFDDIIITEELRKYLDIQTERFLTENPFSLLTENPFSPRAAGYDEYLEKLLRQLPDARLIYLCNINGRQATCNISKNKAGGIERLASYKNKSWIWRGYFRDALKAIATGQKSYLSEYYHDFSTKDKVRTYAYSIDGEFLLLIDFNKIETEDVM